MAIVTAADPLKLVPDKPVPMVNALVVFAAIVMLAEPSNATPLMFLGVVREAADAAVDALPVKEPTKVVDVTLLKPARVVTVEPKETEVEPIVTELFVSPALFTVPEVLTFGVSSDKFLLIVMVYSFVRYIIALTVFIVFVD